MRAFWTEEASLGLSFPKEGKHRVCVCVCVCVFMSCVAGIVNKRGRAVVQGMEEEGDRTGSGRLDPC